MERVTLALQPAGPFNLAFALQYLRTSPSAVAEMISPEGEYHRAVTLGGNDVLLRLRATGTVDAPRLHLTIEGAWVPEETVAAAIDLVHHVFSLTRDPAPFLAIAQTDPVLLRLVEHFAGLRPVLIACPYEALIWAIIGQQINIAFARKLKTALVELGSRTLEVGGERYPLLPLPADIAVMDPAALRARQFSRQKIDYLLAASAAVATGNLNLEGLATLPSEEAIGELIHYRGIGRWTAEYVLMRGLGAPDNIPAADIGLRAIIGRSYGFDRYATEAEVREIAARWIPYRGWATFYWWMGLQNAYIP